MHCTTSYGGFMIPSPPPSTKPDPSSSFTATSRPDPIHFLFFPTTIFNPIGSSSSSFKTKATVNNDRIGFYELLGIQKSGSLPEIKHAYKQLAREYHPDVSPPNLVEENTQRFIRVREAYETLSDPMRRANYDRDVMGRGGLQLAFSSRTRYSHYQYREDTVDKSEWKARWQSQLSELKRRSAQSDARGNMSWAARMRTQREEQSQEL